MKKIVVIFMLIFCVIVISTSMVGAELPLRVVVNGTKLIFLDEQPFIDSNGRTQTPARFIGEALGATVTWEGKEQKAIFVLDGKKLVLYIGKKEYDLDGQKKQMDTVALLQNGRTFVPARYVAEAFGATVRWDGDIRTVYVDTKGNVVPTPQTTKDPITGWIKVESGGDTEYMQIITVSSDWTLLEARYREAEKMFVERYGRADIAKQIFDYARTKKSRDDEIDKRFRMDNKAIDVFGSDNTVQILVWKEGVI